MAYFIGYIFEINGNYKLSVLFYKLAIKNNNCQKAMYGLGCYYDNIKNNSTKAAKYYKMAIDKGNSDAIYKLGLHYYCQKKFDNMEIYYKMAISEGNSNAMYNLGYYYDIHLRKYETAIKYYKMAIDKGNSNAMNSLAELYNRTDIQNYYRYRGKNYDNIIKYYKMAIEKGNSTAIYNLALYYDKQENKYEEAIKYYKMAIEKGDTQAMINLAYYYNIKEKKYNEAKKYYLMAIKNNNFSHLYCYLGLCNIGDINDLETIYKSTKHDAIKNLLLTLYENEYYFDVKVYNDIYRDQYFLLIKNHLNKIEILQNELKKQNEEFNREFRMNQNKYKKIKPYNFENYYCDSIIICTKNRP